MEAFGPATRDGPFHMVLLGIRGKHHNAGSKKLGQICRVTSKPFCPGITMIFHKHDIRLFHRDYAHSLLTVPRNHGSGSRELKLHDGYAFVFTDHAMRLPIGRLTVSSSPSRELSVHCLALLCSGRASNPAYYVYRFARQPPLSGGLHIDLATTNEAGATSILDGIRGTKTSVCASFTVGVRSPAFTPAKLAGIGGHRAPTVVLRHLFFVSGIGGTIEK